jgi:hypothetical protein
VATVPSASPRNVARRGAATGSRARFGAPVAAAALLGSGRGRVAAHIARDATNTTRSVGALLEEHARAAATDPGTDERKVPQTWRSAQDHRRTRHLTDPQCRSRASLRGPLPLRRPRKVRNP